jgi:purine catabolism regulator
MTRILAMARADITTGVSDRLPKTRLAVAREQAVRSLEVARSRQVASLAFGQLAHLGLTGVVEAGAAAAFAVATLEKLTAYEQTSKIEIRESIRVWLAHHGQYEPAAAVLGVHRHTLRYRVRKAAELLGRDLDDPSARMDLWFALTVHSGQREGLDRPV